MYGTPQTLQAYKWHVFRLGSIHASHASTPLPQPYLQQDPKQMFCVASLLNGLVLLSCMQECFTAGYASFNLEPVQYSTTAAAGYAEANKYDPKGVDKYGHETIPAKVS